MSDKLERVRECVSKIRSTKAYYYEVHLVEFRKDVKNLLEAIEDLLSD